MKHYLLKTKCALLVMLAMVGIQVSAQETVTVGEDAIPVVGIQTINVRSTEKVAYAAETATFSVDEVISALGIESISNAAQYIVNVTTGEAVENNTDGWRNAQGDASGWATDSKGVCVKIQQAETGLIDYIGCYSTEWTFGETFSCSWGFVYEGKAALVNVNILFVNATSVVENPFASSTIKVDDADITVEKTFGVSCDVLEKTAYSADKVYFDTNAVLEALGVSSFAECKQYILNATTGEAVENNTDGWRNAQGDASGWSSDSKGVCVKIQEPETGIVDYIGCYSDAWTAGETFVCYWTFVANQKAVVLKVNVNFVAPEGEVDPEPSFELPEAERQVALLDIVGNTSVSLERYFSQGFETSPVTVKASDMAAALGVEKTDLESVFSKMIYIDQYSEGTKTGVMALLTATDGWTRRVLTADGDETNEDCGATYGSDDEIFVQKMAYNAETDEVSFVVGQMPGKMAEGDERFVNLHVVYGNKAYVIKLNVNFVAPPFNGLEDMTKVGGQTIDVAQPINNDYGFVLFSIDLDDIASQLGAESAQDVQMQALTDMGGLSDQHTANNGGWWLTAQGAVTTWGTNSTFFIEPSANNTWTEFHVGQFPNAAVIDEVYSSKLYLLYNGKYYELTVNLTIGEKPQIDTDELTVVASRAITINQTLNTDYGWSEGVVIPNSLLEETIGTTDVKLLALAIGSTEDAPIYSEDYSCDPKPGFWCLSNGMATTWGNSSVWGMSIVHQNSADGVVFNCIQYPGLTEVGATYQGKFYLANADNNKMLEVVVNYNIVESIESVEVIGEEEVVLAVSDDEFKQEVSLDDVVAKLGFETIDEMMSTACMRALNAAGVYASSTEPSNGVLVDDNGYAADEANVGIYFDGNKLCTYVNDSAPADWTVKTDICLELNGKRYIYHLILVSADRYEEAVAIQGVQSERPAQLFDLQGRAVKSAQKGIYILSGKKILK